MPKRSKKDDDDDDESSEYEAEEEDSEISDDSAFLDDHAETTDDEDDENFNGGDDDDNEDDDASGGVTGKGKKSSKRIRKRKRRYDIADDLKGPTSARKTEAGGYSHVKSTKLKISRANKGMVPWNKGKNRNATDRAKISAGVRARNNAIAKKKREAYGISEEEETLLKERIKYLRERVRRAKKDNDARIEWKRKNKRDWEKVEQDLKEQERADIEKDRLAPDEDESDGMEEDSSDQEEHDTSDTGKSKVEEEAAETDEVEDSKPFSQDFAWTAHPLDTQSYRDTCPSGGPGGLICCETCAAQYTQYMLSTFAELERQKISKAAKEGSQLEEFLTMSTRQLEQTVRVARRKSIPIRRIEPASASQDAEV